MDEEEIKFFNDKNFDLYTHMKCNIKCTIRICEIHDSSLNYYCFYCKRSICEVCKESFHSDHHFLSKTAIGLKNKHLPLMFDKLEKAIQETEAFSNPDKLVKNIKQKIVEEFDLMQKRLSELKDRRINEIYRTFNNSNEDALRLLKNIATTKDVLLGFFEKHSGFLEGESVNDDDNYIFLQIFELFNTTVNKSNEYLEIIARLKDYYSDNDLQQPNKFEYILKSIEKGLEEQFLSEKKTETVIFMNEEEPNLPSNKRRKSFTETMDEMFKKQETKEKGTAKGENGREEMDKEELRLFIMSNKKILKHNNYEDIYCRLNNMDEYIQSFKKNVFESFAKHGSLVEVEKLVRLFEEKTVKRMNYLQQSQSVFNSKTRASIRGSKAGLTRSKVNLQKLNKEKEKDQQEKDRDKEKDKEREKEKEGKAEKEKAEKRNSVSSSKATNDSPDKRKKTNIQAEMFSLEEDDNEFDEEPNAERLNQILRKKKQDKKEESCDESSDNSLFGNSDDNKIDVKIEKNVRDNNKVMKKLNNMFRPKPRPVFSKHRNENSIETKSMNQIEDEKFKVNAKLLELIRENQRLTSMIKKQEDITLAITTIRRYFTFCLLEYIKQHYEISSLKNGVSSNMIEASYIKDSSEDQVKVIEGTNELVIYDREKLEIKKFKLKFDKKKLGCSSFLPGCRIYKNQEKVFFSGGKDISGDRKIFLAYDLKEGKLIRLPDMCNARSYHTSLFHESLKSLVVFGGENNSTCEMYDFYLNMWNTIPEMNIPRANPAVYIDKVGTFAYVISGIIGGISSNYYCDVIEFLDLVDMNQGWLKIEIKNKANVDLKNNESKLFPLTDNKLLIYGANESRNINKCFVVLDLKNLELLKVDKEDLDNIRVKAKFTHDEANLI